ncbi:MAG TPA: hypothetical protein VIV60_29885, partial [Polyangiaceae bacterium]
YIGVGFKFKAGSTHAMNGDVFRPIAVSVPTDYTDAPDPSFGDQFGSQYNNANSVLYPTHTPATDNLPICSFPKTPVPPEFKPVGSSGATCFANLTTANGANKPLAISKDWQTFCLKWEDFAAPDWARSGLAAVAFPQGGITNLDPKHAIKLQFDAYKPSSSEGAQNFDFFIDDVELLTSDEWTTFCANAKVVEKT